MKRIIPCVIITLAMIFAGSFLPVLGFVGIMLCPLPLSVLGCIEGHKRTSIAELMIEATLFLAFSPSMAAYFLVGCAPLSSMIFTLSREEFKSVKKYTGAQTLLVCTGASILFKLIMIVLFWLFTKRNIMLPDMSQVEAVMTQLYGSQPELMQAMRKVLAIFPRLMPTLLVIYCAAESLINYVLCSSIVRKYFPDVKNYPPELPAFKLWKFPVSLMIASFVSLLAGYFINVDEWLEVSVFIMNLQIILNVFMFVEGLSVLFWIMDGFRLRRAVKVIICAVISFPFFWAWLIVMGMCDIVLNLRNRIRFGKE